jgi:hypothetical protein
MKGLLKAFVESDVFSFNVDRANRPQRYGCTLLYLNGTLDGDSLDYISWICDEMGVANLQELNGRQIALHVWERLITDRTTLLLCTPDLSEESEMWLKRLYKFPHHITEGWDNGCYPVHAAEDAKQYMSAIARDYWGAVEECTMTGDRFETIPGKEFIEQKKWEITPMDANFIATIEWQEFNP